MALWFSIRKGHWVSDDCTEEADRVCSFASSPTLRALKTPWPRGRRRWLFLVRLPRPSVRKTSTAGTSCFLLCDPVHPFAHKTEEGEVGRQELS